MKHTACKDIVSKKCLKVKAGLDHYVRGTGSKMKDSLFWAFSFGFVREKSLSSGMKDMLLLVVLFGRIFLRKKLL